MFFKKKSKPKKRTMKVNFKYTDPINVGRTGVGLVFKDGTQEQILIYGDYVQYIDYGRDEDRFAYGVIHEMKEPKVHEPRLVSSIDMAKNFLRNVSIGCPCKYILDPEQENAIIIGEIVFAKILDTEDYHKICSIGYLEPKGEDDEKKDI